MEVTRELYNSMAEGDVDVQLDAMDRVLAKRDEAKKDKSIGGDTIENNSGQQKETDANSP